MNENNKVYLYTDGGSRGNPGPACAGYAIFDSDNRHLISAVTLYLGKATNNEAEYAALIFGLKECTQLGYMDVTHVSDSKLVVNQVNGLWKVKQGHLKALVSKVRILIARMGDVSMAWVPSDHPGIVYVDDLVSKRLDEEMRNGKVQRANHVQWKDLLGQSRDKKDDRTSFIEIRHNCGEARIS